MFTSNDLRTRTIFILDCTEQNRHLRVKNGEFLLEQSLDGKNKTLTKFPFQKILALFIIGQASITTPLIEKCKKHNVALIVVKPNLRPVFYWANTAEGNFLLRKRQYAFKKSDLSIARILVANKIENQRACLKKTRKKDSKTLEAVARCDQALTALPAINDYFKLMSLEGAVAKFFFAAYYQNLGWNGRKPRTKCDILNTTLDIGYTLLFNFLECFIRMFGFDLYIGLYHRLWFQRKSLVCDLIEPFRCLIDHTVLLAFHRNQFNENDFMYSKGEHLLKPGKSMEYYKIFLSELTERKMEIFRYIQTFYRAFMGNKPIDTYPKYEM